MATLRFEKLAFHDLKDPVQISLMQHYYFEVAKAELEKIAPFHVERNAITFDGISEQSASNKFNFLLARHMTHLKTRFNNRDVVYIHRNSGIPLMGCLYFGIVDKGTNIIEVKPNTGCNASCVFCSVGEGPAEKTSWKTDYVIEVEYLVEELRKLISYKNDTVTIYINPHGEPLLYADIVELVQGIRAIPLVENIHIITNGMLLTKELVDKLVEAGLSYFNISVHAMDAAMSKQILGTSAYNIDRIKEIATYITQHTKAELLITPVMMRGINDAEMEKIIEFCVSIGCNHIGIQNFLENRRGRNPAKEISWEQFHVMLRQWEETYGVKLIIQEKLRETKQLEKPFKRDDVVKAEVMCNGRAKGEKVAAAKGRCIMVPKCNKEGRITVKITKSIHNIFVGEMVG